MSIANELSCDVATALLVRQATPSVPSQTDLTELMLSFHATLRQLTGQDRKRRRALILDVSPRACLANTATNY